ncbi:hypothetical protein Tco_0625473 [Tanacetum coccineum]|uniref:Uncharacterized protein n=1 Tax=Tanacetum coccineum TaxID=301880 RepID=A0ABQ4WGW8_9ASTR
MTHQLSCLDTFKASYFSGEIEAWNILDSQYPQLEKPTVPLPSSNMILSSAKYGNQFLNDNANLSIEYVLQRPILKSEFISMVMFPFRSKSDV